MVLEKRVFADAREKRQTSEFGSGPRWQAEDACGHGAGGPACLCDTGEPCSIIWTRALLPGGARCRAPRFPGRAVSVLCAEAATGLCAGARARRCKPPAPGDAARGGELWRRFRADNCRYDRLSPAFARWTLYGDRWHAQRWGVCLDL